MEWMNLFLMPARLVIIGLFVYFFSKFFCSFYYDLYSDPEGPFLKRFFKCLDPYKQSFFYYKYNFFIVFVLISAVIILCYYLLQEKAYHNALLSNFYIYQFNFYPHELGHRFLIGMLPDWFVSFGGPFAEIMTPIFIYFILLRGRNWGKVLSPFVLYWISSAFFSVGVYCEDAKLMRLHLTDMFTVYKPGEMKGDFYYILKPLGLIEYSVYIGMALKIIAVILFVLAVYSIFNYLMYLSKDPVFDNEQMENRSDEYYKFNR